MFQESRRRHPAEGGYARGEETRLRIILVAIDLFGRLGFDGVSTREIAAAAGVNAPALQYYFQGKEGLYRACAEHIAQRIAAAVDPLLNHARRMLRDGADDEALIGVYCEIMGSITDFLICTPEGLSSAPMLGREHAGLGPDVARHLLHERFVEPLHEVCALMVGRITRRPPGAPETQLRMLAVNGQLLAFHPGRTGLLASLGWSDISPEHARFIKAMVVDHTRALLQAEQRASLAAD